MDTLLEKRYFDWMVEKIGGRRGYESLLRYLFYTPFVYTIPMDGNRYEDGIDLRYRFGAENDISGPEIASEVDYTDCSLFEVMVAMALRCEEHIMADDDLGDRTPIWFWHMIESLGLMGLTDDVFDEQVAKFAIDRMYDRGYFPNGEGGLVRVNNTTKDMRRLELWDQMMVYLNEVLDEERS